MRFSIIFMILVSLSCTRSLTKMYGLNTIDTISKEHITELAKIYNLKGNLYELDTSIYSFLKKIEILQKDIDTNWRKKSVYYKFSQPLIYLFYKNDDQVSCLNNCYTGGFPNLTWNKSGNLNEFPPVTTAPLDPYLPLHTILSFIKPINESHIKISIEKEYQVLVFWNRLMGRQTKIFLEEVAKHLQLADEKNFNVIYINNDNFLHHAEQSALTQKNLQL